MSDPQLLCAGELVAERYEVLGTLGSGGMGAVYRVFDRELREEIALKRIHAELASSEVVFERFRNEVLLARSLAHPNIVRTFDIGKAPEGFYYLTMEYVDGATLKDAIQQRRLRSGTGFPAKEAAAILRQVLQGIQYAHSRGIIHRDLKPANILIATDGTVKLGDFGTARLLSSRLELTPTGHVVGTPYYMSPEQVRSEELDERCDIYSLGIIAFELAIGTRPFEGESYFAVAHKQLNEPLPTLPKETVPPWYQQMVVTATQKDPAKRFPSAKSFAQALDGGTGQRDGDEPFQTILDEPPITESRSRRHSLQNLVLVLLIVAPITGAALYLLMAGEAGEQKAASPGSTTPQSAASPRQPEPDADRAAMLKQLERELPATAEGRSESSASNEKAAGLTESVREEPPPSLEEQTPESEPARVARAPVDTADVRPTEPEPEGPAPLGTLYFRESGQADARERFSKAQLKNARWVVIVPKGLPSGSNTELLVEREDDTSALLRLPGTILSLGSRTDPEMRIGGSLAAASALAPGAYRARVVAAEQELAQAPLVFE